MFWYSMRLLSAKFELFDMCASNNVQQVKFFEFDFIQILVENVSGLLGMARSYQLLFSFWTFYHGQQVAICIGDFCVSILFRSIARIISVPLSLFILFLNLAAPETLSIYPIIDETNNSWIHDDVCLATC